MPSFSAKVICNTLLGRHNWNVVTINSTGTLWENVVLCQINDQPSCSLNHLPKTIMWWLLCLHCSSHYCVGLWNCGCQVVTQVQKSVTRHTVLWGECSVYNMLPPVTATLFVPNCSCWWHQPTQRNHFQEEHDCDTLFQLPPNLRFMPLPVLSPYGFTLPQKKFVCTRAVGFIMAFVV